MHACVISEDKKLLSESKIARIVSVRATLNHCFEFLSIPFYRRVVRKQKIISSNKP